MTRTTKRDGPSRRRPTPASAARSGLKGLRDPSRDAPRAAGVPVAPRSRLPLVLLAVALIAVAGVVAVLARGTPNSGASGPNAGAASTATAPAGTEGAASSATVPVVSERPASSATFPSAGADGGLVSGTALPLLTDAAVDPALGRAIPAITGSTLDGRPIAVRPDDGRPKVLMFLAHWCPHCQAEVPVVQSWLDAGGPKGAVDLYAIATGNDPQRPNYPASAWLAREGWTVPTVLDSDAFEIGQAFGLSAFPYWVFVNPDGTVSRRITGELAIPDLEAMIAEVTR